MSGSLREQPPLRLAELIASLSLALDLAQGQPLEYFLRACLAAVRLGEELGLSERELADIYYLALLRHAGCTAESHSIATIFGSDIAANTWVLGLDMGRPQEIMTAIVRNTGQGEAPWARTRRIASAMVAMPRKSREVYAAHCEVAQGIAARIGFGPTVHQALGQMFERWDGKGGPVGIKGEAITPAVRIVQLAADAALYHRLGGVEGAVAVTRQRASGAHDPALVERFCRVAPTILRDYGGASMWETVLAAEPGPRPIVGEDQLDEAARALGDAVDLKTPFLSGHSHGVSTLAGAAAERCGLAVADVVAIRRAGYLHDLGRIGISSGIWQKAGPLTDDEWERVRLHPYYTERVLSRPKALAGLGALAALHHERLDGSGYHRGIPAALLTAGARILAAADVYQALTEERAHRSVWPPDRAAEELRREVRSGRLDGEAVRGVLAAAGHHTRSTRRAWPADLSDREVVVLRLVARGLANREIARQLSVSPRTIEHHIEHIFDKTALTTRASLTFFALQYNLLSDSALAEK